MWYRVINVRKNFGTNGSQYYVHNLDTDPAEHFAKNFKRFWPAEAKPQTVVSESGKTMKVYQPYGRIARRVLYNVLFAANAAAKGHVLDLPSYNGADNIDKYHNSKNANGTDRGMICDPDCCVPVFIQCTDSTNPWKIIPSPSEPITLPAEYRDVEMGYFYNLDEVTEGRDPEAIIADLKNFFPKDVFDTCMNGYHGHGHTSAPVQGFTPAVPAPANPVFAPALPQQSSALPQTTAPALPSVTVSALPKSLAAALPQAPVFPPAQGTPPSGPTVGMTPQQALEQLNLKK